MTRVELESLARRQLADYDSHSPGTMFAEGGGTLTIDDAYRLQIEVARFRRLRGEAIAGYKIGCVSQAVQQQLGIANPVFGHVFESEIRPTRAVLASSEFDHLAIEGEIAVTLAADVSDPEVLRDAPHEFVTSVFPVIELHNYVVRGRNPSAVEAIANNAFHAGVVAADRQPSMNKREPLEISVWINAEQQGVASADPFATLYTLAKLLAAVGINLRRDEIVLTGSPLPLCPVNPGENILVRCPTIAEVAATVET